MNKTSGKSGSGLTREDLVRYQADLIWMHNRTIRELEEAKKQDAREEEARAKQASNQPQK